jgi:hypothetical protein
MPLGRSDPSRSTGGCASRSRTNPTSAQRGRMGLRLYPVGTYRWAKRPASYFLRQIRDRQEHSFDVPRKQSSDAASFSPDLEIIFNALFGHYRSWAKCVCPAFAKLRAKPMECATEGWPRRRLDDKLPWVADCGNCSDFHSLHFGHGK